MSGEQSVLLAYALGLGLMLGYGVLIWRAGRAAASRGGEGATPRGRRGSSDR